MILPQSGLLGGMAIDYLQCGCGELDHGTLHGAIGPMA